MTTLLLYLDATDGAQDFPWALRGADGQLSARGSAAIADLPAAERCVIILPWHRSTIHRVRLPDVNVEKLQGSLQFAIENELLGDPAATYASFAGRDAGGLASIVSTDRATLESALIALRSKKLPVDDMVAEVLAVPVQAGAWTVVLREDGGFVRTSTDAGFSLDMATGGQPPAQLRLALAEAKSAGRAPSRLIVRADPANVAAQGWQDALGVAVDTADPWTWESAQATGTPGLLQGDLRQRKSYRERLRPWVPVLSLLGAIVVVQFAFTLLHWAMLSWESARLNREIEGLFRQAVPEAQAIVDPPLQLRRLVTDLRRASGALSGDDFLVLIGRAAPEIERAPGGKLRTIDYASGSLRVELLVQNAEAAAELVQKLVATGLRAKLETSSGAGSLVLARITISEGAR